MQQPDTQPPVAQRSMVVPIVAAVFIGSVAALGVALRTSYELDRSRNELASSLAELRSLHDQRHHLVSQVVKAYEGELANLADHMVRIEARLDVLTRDVHADAAGSPGAEKQEPRFGLVTLESIPASERIGAGVNDVFYIGDDGVTYRLKLFGRDGSSPTLTEEERRLTETLFENHIYVYQEQQAEAKRLREKAEFRFFDAGDEDAFRAHVDELGPSGSSLEYPHTGEGVRVFDFRAFNDRDDIQGMREESAEILEKLGVRGHAISCIKTG